MLVPYGIFFQGQGELDLIIHICDVAVGDGCWNFAWLSFVLPAAIVDHIVAHAPLVANSGLDYIAWKWSARGSFSSSKTYKHMFSSSLFGVPLRVQRIWKAGVPQHVCMFLWLLIHDKLLTNEVRTKRGMCDVPCCELRGEIVQLALYAIRDCASVRPIWYRIIPRDGWDYFFTLPL